MPIQGWADNTLGSNDARYLILDVPTQDITDAFPGIFSAAYCEVVGSPPLYRNLLGAIRKYIEVYIYISLA